MFIVELRVEFII